MEKIVRLHPLRTPGSKCNANAALHGESFCLFKVSSLVDRLGFVVATMIRPVEKGDEAASYLKKLSSLTMKHELARIRSCTWQAISPQSVISPIQFVVSDTRRMIMEDDELASGSESFEILANGIAEARWYRVTIDRNKGFGGSAFQQFRRDAIA
jgi:hypothetical protein